MRALIVAAALTELKNSADPAEMRVFEKAARTVDDICWFAEHVLEQEEERG